jgi:hypothetical protein
MDPLETGGEQPQEQSMDMEAAVADIASSLQVAPEEGENLENSGNNPDEKQSQADASSPASPPPETKVAGTPPPAPLTLPDSEDKAPDTWTKEAKEKWSLLPPELKQEVRKREADIAKHVAATNEATNVGKNFEKVISPYLGELTKRGINPWTHTENLLRAHATLVMGSPEQKVAMFRQLALDSGIDPGALTTAGSAAANNPLVQHISALQQRINQLEQGVTGVTSSVQAARAAELEASVLAFAQDEAAHPFFYEVVDDIQHLIQTKAATTLDKAYELAIMANPVTRQKMVEREIQKRLDTNAVQDRERAEKAKKAATGTVKANGRGRAAPAIGTIDDTLKEALASIHSRETH